MAILQAVLSVDEFTAGALKMVDSLATLYRALDESYRTMQKFQVTMSVFSGSMGQASADLNTLYNTANKLGISFESAAAPFAKFAGAAQGLSRSQVFKVFDSFATTLSAVRANGQEVNGVFLALQQIVSKGKLSMEELRLQLAERIPGSMKIAAQAAGMSMTQFESAVRSGTINTNKWLLNFADLLEKQFGGAAKLAAKTFDAEMNRMSNSMLKFNADIVSMSGSGDIWAEIVRGINSEVFNSEDAFGAAGKIVQDFSYIAKDLFLTLLPTVVPTLQLVSGATSLFGRAMAIVSTDANLLYASLSGLRTMYFELKLASLEFWNTGGDNDDAINDMKMKILESKAATADYLVNMAEAGERVTKEYDAISRAIDNVNNKTNQSTKAIDEQIQKLVDLQQQAEKSLTKDFNNIEKDQQAKEKSIEEMYKTAGVGSELYFDLQAKKLVEQASNWRKAGADQLRTSQWLSEELTKLSKTAWDKGHEAASITMTQYADDADSLITKFDEANRKINESLKDIASKVTGLDGSSIEITATLQGGAVISGIDELMAKFRALQDAANAAYNARHTYNAGGPESWDEFLDRHNRQDNQSSTPNRSSSTTARIVNNFNQQLSRSDIANINSEQMRRLARA